MSDSCVFKVGGLYRRIDPMRGIIRTDTSIYEIKMNDIMTVTKVIEEQSRIGVWEILFTTGELGLYSCNKSMIEMLWEEI